MVATSESMTFLISPSSCFSSGFSSKRGTGCVCQNLYDAMSFAFLPPIDMPVRSSETSSCFSTSAAFFGSMFASSALSDGLASSRESIIAGVIFAPAGLGSASLSLPEPDMRAATLDLGLLVFFLGAEPSVAVDSVAAEAAADTSSSSASGCLAAVGSSTRCDSAISSNERVFARLLGVLKVY